jgi:hypothetical protein
MTIPRDTELEPVIMNFGEFDSKQSESSREDG